VVWEEITAHAVLMGGASIVVLRHPKTISLVKATIDKLMSA
jgi:hypothetical protein